MHNICLAAKQTKVHGLLLVVVLLLLLLVVVVAPRWCGHQDLVQLLEHVGPSQPDAGPQWPAAEPI